MGFLDVQNYSKIDNHCQSYYSPLPPPSKDIHIAFNILNLSPKYVFLYPIFLCVWWITLGKNIWPDLKVIAVWMTYLLYCIVNLFHGTSRLPAIQLEARAADKAEWHVTSRKLKFSADGCLPCDVTMTLHWRRPEYSLFHQNRLNCLPSPAQAPAGGYPA